MIFSLTIRKKPGKEEAIPDVQLLRGLPLAVSQARTDGEELSRSSIGRRIA